MQKYKIGNTYLMHCLHIWFLNKISSQLSTQTGDFVWVSYSFLNEIDLSLIFH